MKVYTELIDGATSIGLAFSLLGDEFRRHTPTLCQVKCSVIFPCAIMASVSVHGSHCFSRWILLCELLWFGIQAFSKLLLDLNVEL